MERPHIAALPYTNDILDSIDGYFDRLRRGGLFRSRLHIGHGFLGRRPGNAGDLAALNNVDLGSDVGPAAGDAVAPGLGIGGHRAAVCVFRGCFDAEVARHQIIEQLSELIGAIQWLTVSHVEDRIVGNQRHGCIHVAGVQRIGQGLHGGFRFHPSHERGQLLGRFLGRRPRDAADLAILDDVDFISFQRFDRRRHPGAPGQRLALDRVTFDRLDVRLDAKIARHQLCVQSTHRINPGDGLIGGETGVV